MVLWKVEQQPKGRMCRKRLHKQVAWNGQKGWENDTLDSALGKNLGIGIGVSSVSGCIDDISEDLLDALGIVIGSSAIFTIAQFA